MIRDRAVKYCDREVFRYRDNNTGHYKSISWKVFVDEVARIAVALDDLGYGYDSKIGIFSNNRPEWLIADLAIMTVRGATVPFFGNASLQQVIYIVDETEMKLMFVGNVEQLEKAFWLMDHCDSLEQVILMNPDHSSDDQRCTGWNDLKTKNDSDDGTALDRILEAVEPDDLATIIYTSGTTGEPKGVMLGQESFMFTFGNHDRRLNLEDSDISLCFLPLSHVFERSWSLYLLHVGAINVFLENPKEVIEVLPKVKPTLMCTVPRFFEKTHEGIQKEYESWPGIKQKIFDWAIRTGHQTLKYRRHSKNIPIGLDIKYKIADKLVFKTIRKIFGGNIKAFPCSGSAIRPDLLRYFHAVGIYINYGYGATETTATVSCFKPHEYEFDSCGTVLPGVSVKFDENKEIMVKGKTVFRGYYKKIDETDEVLTDGWYKTGDEGYLTSEGNLMMTDRLRNIIKTSVGKFVSPQKVELLLGQDDFIEQIVVIGDNRKFITAVIVPAFENLKAYAKKNDIEFRDHNDLIEHQKIISYMEDRINFLQDELTPYERVVKFELLPEPFSIENKALTTTLKIRRKVIEIKYKELIDNMYADS